MTEKGRIIQINPVLRTSTSTGRIMQEIGTLAETEGWRVWCAYGKGRDGIRTCATDIIPVGGWWSTAVHGALTRAFDRHGLGSESATREFVRKLREIDPDIIHIHNIHGYFLNYPILFDYLAGSRAQVVWTVHDCWLFTGHCYHYDYIGCDRWQYECCKCPQRGAFPRSIIVDRSRKNYIDKRKYFTSIPHNRMIIVPVSHWMREEMSHSFLKDYEFRVIHNGIDLDVFSPQPADAAREKYGVNEPKIYLGIASIWLEEKGLGAFMQMAGMLRPGERIVLVGKMPPGMERRLPDGVTHIRRTENVAELAQLYSAASVLVNPTMQDNYPTVNLEAQACGCSVATYRTGGSPESLTPATGRVVEAGDVEALLEAARLLAEEGDGIRMACRSHALANFSKQDRYADYIRLYEELLAR